MEMESLFLSTVMAKLQVVRGEGLILDLPPHMHDNATLAIFCWKPLQGCALGYFYSEVCKIITFS